MLVVEGVRCLDGATVRTTNRGTTEFRVSRKVLSPCFDRDNSGDEVPILDPSDMLLRVDH